jgi:hypothetical protein
MFFLKKVKSLASLLAAAVLFPACESIVEVPIPAHTPKLAIRCTIGNETLDDALYTLYPTFQPFVSHSQSILSTNEIKGINDASIIITDEAGRVMETFRPADTTTSYLGEGYYSPVSRFTPEAGKRYTLKASAPGFEEVTSTLTIPYPVNGIQGTFVKKSDIYAGIDGRVTLTFPDNGSENNYYMISALLVDSQGKVSERDYFTEDEDNTGLETNINDIHFSEFRYQDFYGFKPFDDKSFNGNSITISRNVSLTFNSVSSTRPKALRLVVSSITEDSYKFLKSLQLYMDTNGNPFAEPVRVKGNIENGYGYFGGYANAYYDIPL